MTSTTPAIPALVLATWWASFLARIAPQDHGDDSDIGGVTTLMMLTLATHNHHTSEEAARVKAALARQFQGQLDRHGYCKAWTDYSPSTVLCVAATIAQISLSDVILPIKSSSTGNADQVRVRQGYTGEWQSIWTPHNDNLPAPLKSNPP